MDIFKKLGIVMIILGTLCGGILILAGCTTILQGSVFSLWVLYIFCFAGGFIIYSLSFPEALARDILRMGGSILIITGIISASVILIYKVGLIKLNAKVSLWLLLMICICSGVLAILMSERVENRKAGEILKELPKKLMR
ncbi:hypothetical protein QUF80_19280 [Desulfococcaceae bacterium HSG8]|nr:hypothetical protein [Desulfococcaceae bacterium HSG8]